MGRMEKRTGARDEGRFRKSIDPRVETPARREPVYSRAVEAKAAFYGILKTEFAPRLRELGFVGSGIHFRRVRGEVIHVVDIQGSKYGGSSAVNLGLHATFLPMGHNGQLPDPKKIKEVECDFRMRLAPDGRNDHWWKYAGLLRSPEKAARNLIDMYLRVGEPRFERISTVEQMAAMIPLDEMSAGPAKAHMFGNWIGGRTALSIARIHAHLGRIELARAFGERALDMAGKAQLLRDEATTFMSELDRRPAH